VRSGAISEIACAGVFPFIGSEPASAGLPADLLEDSGHVRAGADLATADPRIFAAGAIRTGFGGNAVQAMAEGTGAAEAAHHTLTNASSRKTTKLQAKVGG